MSQGEEKGMAFDPAKWSCSEYCYIKALEDIKRNPLADLEAECESLRGKWRVALEDIQAKDAEIERLIALNQESCELWDAEVRAQSQRIKELEGALLSAKRTLEIPGEVFEELRTKNFRNWSVHDLDAEIVSIAKALNPKESEE